MLFFANPVTHVRVFPLWRFSFFTSLFGVSPFLSKPYLISVSVDTASIFITHRTEASLFAIFLFAPCPGLSGSSAPYPLWSTGVIFFSASFLSPSLLSPSSPLSSLLLLSFYLSPVHPLVLLSYLSLPSISFPSLPFPFLSFLPCLFPRFRV